MNQRMQNSRLHLILLTIALQTALIVTAPAQQRQEILATSKLRSFTAKDLNAEIRDAYLNQKRDFAQLRLSLLSQFLAEKLLDLEAKATGSSAENLIEMARKGAEPPSEKQISDFYAANAKNLNGLSLEESRKQIAEYLTAQAGHSKSLNITIVTGAFAGPRKGASEVEIACLIIGGSLSKILTA